MRCSIIGGTVDEVKSAGGTSIKEMSNSPIIFADLSEEQASALIENGYQVSEVKEITPPVTTPVPVSGAPTYTPLGLLEMLGIEEFRQMTDPPLTGEGIYVAIIGTGIRATHQDIGGMVVYSKNYTTSPSGDGFDHDTAVASIVHTIVPKTGLLDLKVIGNTGSGTDESVVEAIDDCISMRQQQHEYAPDVLNMSLGAVDDGNYYSPMRIICRDAVNAGIWLVASAGNQGPASMSIMMPACEKYVMAVGSCGLEPFDVSSFSSRGPTLEGLVKPDAVMFGEDIIMASSKGDTATAAKSGTSFSAPFASGACALFLNGERVWGDFSTASGMPEFIRRQVPYPMTQEGLIDIFLPQTGIKPSGASTSKDNDYGFGLPYAPLLFEKMTIATNIGTLVGGVMMVGMMGMMMKTMMAGAKGERHD